MHVHSEMKTPSGDGIADMSYSCHPKVKAPKEYEHSIIQIRKDLNNSVISIKHIYISLNFIMSLHLTSGIHEILYIPVFIL